MGSSQTGAGLLHMRGRVQRMRWGKAVSSGCLCWRGGKSIAVCRHGGRAGQGMLTNQSTGVGQGHASGGGARQEAHSGEMATWLKWRSGWPKGGPGEGEGLGSWVRSGCMRTAGRGELLLQQVGRGEGGMLGKM